VGKVRVLIVEDEALVARDLQSGLKAMGYDVPSVASSGEEAVVKVEKDKADIVLMDIRLEGRMDGIEAASLINSRFGVPVIFVTAYSEQHMLERAKVVEPFGYILKPYQDRDLRIAIEMALYKAKHDVERKKAEEALRRSEELYRITLGSISDAVFITDNTGVFTFICPNVETIFGYTFGEVQAFGNISNLIGNDLYDPKDLESSEEIINIEQEILDKHGRSHALLVNVKRVSIKRGTVLYSCRDITERKQVEEALQKAHDELEKRVTERTIELVESEKRYRSLVEMSPEAVVVQTQDKIVYINPEGAKIYGAVNQAALIGKSIFEIVHPDYHEAVQARIAQIQMEGKLKIRSTHKNIRLDGKVVEVESIGTRITYLGQPAVLTIIRDVTEQKEAQKNLKKSEARFQELFDDAPVGYHEIDADGRITRINRTELDMLGYSAEEMLGRPIWEFVLEKEDARKLIMDKISGAKPIGESFERTRKRKDGTTFPGLVQHRCLHDEAGHITGLRTTIQDITERKKAEEEKRGLEAQLHRALKMEAVGTLAGGVAHDLNNVLSGIVAYPDLLLMQLPDGSPLKTPILAMQDSGVKAAAIVHDLLTLARRGAVHAEVMNLNDIISKYLKSPQYEKLKAHHPGVKVEIDLESDILNISSSHVHLFKSVMNLVSNAAEAIADGGKIFISTENRYIDRPLSGYDSVEEGDYITLSVSDNGVGISSEDKEKIFEPFYTKKIMGRSGTGLGMSVVWNTVKDHNGYIDVQSTEGKGTVFTLFFPATRQEIAKEKVQLPIENYMGKGESILVVDDIKGQRDMALTILTTFGYKADAVSSGERAVDYLKEQRVELIVLDMIMDPGMDGLDTYKEILKVHPVQKAIIASGFSETDRVKEAQRLGAGAYIKKPYTLEKIGMAVKAELEK
jgi:PAS domain S-box-containing protein